MKQSAIWLCESEIGGRPPEHDAWVEASELTAQSFFLFGDQLTVQR